MATAARDDRILAPTRWTARLIVPVLAAAFVLLYGWPDRTRQLWAWTIGGTMTPMTMGGGYLAGAYLFARVATTRQWHRAAVGILGAWLFATMLGLATLLHLEAFNRDHVSFWAWSALYAATPVLLPWLWVVNHRTDPGVAEPGDPGVPRPLRLAVGIGGVGQLAFAGALFARPSLFLDRWPWELTPLTARTLSAFLAFPALAWAWFLVDERWSSFEIPVETAAMGLGLVLVGALRAGDELGGAGLGRGVYLSALGATLAGLVALRVGMGRAQARALAGASS